MIPNLMVEDLLSKVLQATLHPMSAMLQKRTKGCKIWSCHCPVGFNLTQSALVKPGLSFTKRLQNSLPPELLVDTAVEFTLLSYVFFPPSKIVSPSQRQVGEELQLLVLAQWQHFI